MVVLRLLCCLMVVYAWFALIAQDIAWLFHSEGLGVFARVMWCPLSGLFWAVWNLATIED